MLVAAGAHERVYCPAAGMTSVCPTRRSLGLGRVSLFASKMISHLAEFSRMALSRGSMDILTVAEELEIIRLYLEMEQIRFSDYLTVSFDIEPGTEDIKIPALVLQPLLENAVKYGSRTSPDALDITISARMQPPERLRLEISNSGQWVEPGTTESRYSTGTGIENIKKKLDRYYSEQFRFENRLEKGQVTIVIDLPREIGNGNGVLNHSDWK